jgi:hypothetical protein
MRSLDKIVIHVTAELWSKLLLHFKKCKMVLLNISNGVNLNASISKGHHKLLLLLLLLLKLNSVALVLELTIPTERPPLVGEVSANFCG